MYRRDQLHEQQSILCADSATTTRPDDVSRHDINEMKTMCNTQKDFTAGSRRAAGVLVAARPCRIVTYIVPMDFGESVTCVYFPLADMVAFMLEQRNLNLANMSEGDVHAWLAE